MPTMSWLFWLLCVTAAVASSRAATVMADGPQRLVQRGNRALLQALAFPAILLLMAAPFFALPWAQAAALSITAAVFNPVILLVNPGNAARVLRSAPRLNALALVGAAYFALWMTGVVGGSA